MLACPDFVPPGQGSIQSCLAWHWEWESQCYCIRFLKWGDVGWGWFALSFGLDFLLLYYCKFVKNVICLLGAQGGHGAVLFLGETVHELLCVLVLGGEGPSSCGGKTRPCQPMATIMGSRRASRCWAATSQPEWKPCSHSQVGGSEHAGLWTGLSCSGLVPLILGLGSSRAAQLLSKGRAEASSPNFSVQGQI